jgi:hypothetical protein
MERKMMYNHKVKRAMKSETLSIIKYINDEKSKRKVHPQHALRIQILSVMRQRLDTALEELTKEGKIKEIETLNDKAYEIKS